MLRYSNEQLATIIGVPIVSILLVWTVAIFHKNRKRWNSYDIAIVAILVQSILRNLTILCYAVLIIAERSYVPFDYCKGIVWIFNSLHTFQASSLTTLAVIALFTVKLYKKQQNLQQYLTATHVIYHLFCLTTLCACVGVASILAQDDGAQQKNKHFSPITYDDNGQCKFMPFELDVKFNIFIIVLHIFLAMVSLTAFTFICFNHLTTKRQGFDYLKKSTSDLSELSLSLTASVNENGNKTYYDTYMIQRVAQMENNFDNYENQMQNAHRETVWNSDLSNISMTVSSTNSKRPCLKKPLQNEEETGTGLQTMYPVLTVCYLFNHLPLILLCIFPRLITPWSVSGVALWMGQLQDVLIAVGLGLVDSRFCKWVSETYKCTEARSDSDKIPPGVGLDGKFRHFGSQPQSLEIAQSYPERARVYSSEPKFPITNGSLYTSIDGRLPIIHNYRRQKDKNGCVKTIAPNSLNVNLHSSHLKRQEYVRQRYALPQILQENEENTIAPCEKCDNATVRSNFPRVTNIHEQAANRNQLQKRISLSEDSLCRLDKISPILSKSDINRPRLVKNKRSRLCLAGRMSRSQDCLNDLHIDLCRFKQSPEAFQKNKDLDKHAQSISSDEEYFSDSANLNDVSADYEITSQSSFSITTEANCDFDFYQNKSLQEKSEDSLNFTDCSVYDERTTSQMPKDTFTDEILARSNSKLYKNDISHLRITRSNSKRSLENFQAYVNEETSVNFKIQRSNSFMTSDDCKRGENFNPNINDNIKYLQEIYNQNDFLKKTSQPQITTYSSSVPDFKRIFISEFLENNKPYEYDYERNALLKCIGYIYNYQNNCVQSGSKKNGESCGIVEDEVDEVGGQEVPTVSERRVKSIDERIDILVKDIQVRFILKWYLNISTDPFFLSESKVLIDDIIRHFLQIVIDIDGRKLIYGYSIILLKHLKEFRKTIKRCQKTNGSVEKLYRYSHIGSKSDKAAEYFIYQLTCNVFRQFINWELWNSLPCQSLVSILSKKFTTYLLKFISTPGYLNYKIVELCASDVDKSRLKLNKYSFISLSDVDHSGKLTQLQNAQDVKRRDIKSLIRDEYNTPKISPKKSVKSDAIFDREDISVTDSTKSSKIELNDPNEDNSNFEKNMEKIPPESFELSEPVKIYESKSESNKTWRNSSDLECISLGQDLLAFQEFQDPDAQIQQLIEKKLWKDNTDVIEEEKNSSMWDVEESWCGEHESVPEPVEISNEAISPNNFQNYLKSTANNAFKPIGDVTTSTLNNMKELQQTTVHNVSQATSSAIHKIGDLQDEAAGVVEGILDFGIAGLRKGLRLTGLQDNISELTQKAKNEFHDLHKTIDMQIPITTSKITEAIKIIDHDLNKHKSPSKLVKTPHITSEEKIEHVGSSSESDESVWINPLTKESPSFEGDILLERTPDAPKSFTEIINKRQVIKAIPKIAESDIPQITKDMVIIESPEPEYEDTQDFASTIAKLRSLLQQKSSESGFTTPSLSPMPQDEMKTSVEPDMTKINGTMPSLYKFCTRTATGVFQNTLNTIKTALPGNSSEAAQIQNLHNDWTFVEADSYGGDFDTRVKKLLSERQAYCTVDTAYEAIQSLDITDQPELVTPLVHFEDELEGFDVHIPITKVLVDIVCELLADTKISLLQESVVKALLLFIGNYTEEYVTKQSDSLLHNINKIVGKLPENTNQEVFALQLDEMAKICLKKFPAVTGIFKTLLGAEPIEVGIKMLINSLQSPKINQDIFMQVFELFASQLISACNQSSPTYSA
ncbi:hypothetical protein FQA39_LY10033 [Lamprigera yunnana]|nr:hypothetical protein FQA39_LY10033 [Lamprigera yunnana]